ncbi:MAG: Fe-S cluster assembly protein SufD [Candidatus Korobacteraceae bacterium]
MITAERAPQHYTASFTEFERRAAGSQLPWLRELRREAFARFCEVGFPTTHDEDWRFTSVSAIANTQFELAREVPSAVSAAQLTPWRNEGAGCELVFVDGHFAPELSTRKPLPGGVTVMGLAQALSSEASLVAQHLGHYVDQHRDSFAALNTAFADDGAYVHVPRGLIVEEPIWLLYLSTGNGLPLMSHPRNLILVEEQSEVAIVEEYISLGSSEGMFCNIFCNSVTELVAGDNAVVSHYRIEREQAGTRNISTLRIQLGRSTNIATHSVLLGGALVRNNVHTVLAGEGGECLINGLFLGGGDEHIDNYMLVEHASPHCGSRQFYNGILDGKAHGVFHGRIIVHRDAQKTDAKQTNRNLLLSDDAQIDTKPQLEIHADDVKCTHGATIGQIDEEALFYLRSRGVGEVSARRLLLLAFAGECMARMKEGPARRHVEALVNQSVLRITGTAESDGGPDGMVIADDAAAPALAPSGHAENASVAKQTAAAQPGTSVEEAVWAELRSVFDPEIPVNIVDLGLIYSCAITPLPDSGNRVEVRMTLTAPGCAVAGAIKEEVERKLARLPGAREVRVELVFDPPWQPSRMTEAARLQLGFDADFGGRKANSNSSELPIWKPGK